MILFVGITSVIVFLQLLYLGLVRREVEMGFLGQDATITRFGTTLAEIRKKNDRTSDNSDYLNQRISKLEIELEQFKMLYMKLLAERVEERDKKSA